MLENVENAGMCCSKCRKHPLCQIWVYGVAEPLLGDGLQSLVGHCYLRALGKNESVKKVLRQGVSSGSCGSSSTNRSSNSSSVGNHSAHGHHSNGGSHQRKTSPSRNSLLNLAVNLLTQHHNRTKGGSTTNSSNASSRKGMFGEVSEDNVEWEVVSPTVPVLLEVREDKVIYVGHKCRGEVLPGQKIGNHVRLTHDFGYVPIQAANRTIYLQKRVVKYKKLLSGTCVEASMAPIYDPAVCAAAAVSLGYFDQHVTDYGGEPRPEGCYLHKGAVWLSTAAGNRGRGAFRFSLPLCSSGSYPTSTTTTTTSTSTTRQNTTLWGYPSLLCFEVVRANSFEITLACQQQQRQMSVFACDEGLVFSDGEEPQSLGNNDNGFAINTVVEPALSRQDRKTDDPMAKPWPNTEDFIEVWSYLREDGRFLNHDWTTKVDPDAVFFPDRLRGILVVHTHQPDRSLYVTNCLKLGSPVFYNPIEPFSRAALRTFFDNRQKCLDLLPLGTLAEAEFMSRCMDMLGVGHVLADNLLSDLRCTHSPCSDGIKVAYYNYSDASPTGSWFRCWYESTGLSLSINGSTVGANSNANASNATI